MDVYEFVTQVSRMHIEAIQKERSLSPTDIRKEVELARELADQNPRYEQNLSSEQCENLIRELEALYQTVIGEERVLTGSEEGWEPWFLQRRGEVDWKYWKRYRKFMARQSFSEKVLFRLDSSTDKIVQLLGDPEQGESWDRRGLVVGLVQSGKTANYIGVINKAVDVGYKVIVVLTGFTNSLRSQTQDRIEEGVLGYSLRPDPKNPGQRVSNRCGVELIAPIQNPKINSVTTLEHDFRAAIAMNFGIQVGGNPIIFVIKKNATVLRNLIGWVTNVGNAIDDESYSYVTHHPLLVIDDESDIGSVDTGSGVVNEEGDPNPEHDPSKINKQIRKLLGLFDQSSYVGYTATPFANVLIHDQGRAGRDPDDGMKIGDDLFPRSFIVSLPTPSDYVGPSMIFGTGQGDSDIQEGLPIIREIDDTDSDDDNGDSWMPTGHKITHRPCYKGEDTIPPSLREAIHSFILVCAARRCRGDAKEHNSMLVHVTRFVRIQEVVKDQVDRELRLIVDRICNSTATTGLFTELRELWEEEPRSFVATTRKINQRPELMFQHDEHTWEEIEEQLSLAAASIKVKEINGSSTDALEYNEHPDGLNVIAIGGNKLARGLTLAGLSVSYFLRSSRMYDTLMQMGRWFGFRPRYLDLCRLYTTSELSEWFYHIASATEELRHEFERMEMEGGTPKQFGLRVRSHPELLVTSAVKARHATTIQVCFQGSLRQTLYFNRNAETVGRNWTAAEQLIETIERGAGGNSGAYSVDDSSENKGVWTNVPAALIMDFLDQYQSHKDALRVKPSLLKDYIQVEGNENRLTSWTVVLSGGRNQKKVHLGQAEVRLVERSWNYGGGKNSDEDENQMKEKLKAKDLFRIGVLTSPRDEEIGLDQEKINKAMEKTIENWEKGSQTKDKPTYPDGPFLRSERQEEEGLLVLYPLSPDDEKAENTDLPILGFAVSFPTVWNALSVTHLVNNVYSQGLELENN
jgi:hypothetical protein